MILFNIEQRENITNLNPSIESKFLYNKEKRKNLNKDYKKLIQKFENNYITRQDIIHTYKEYFNECSKDNYMKAFLLTMIWGFADTGYGTYRTNKYIESQENRDYIESALNFVNQNNLQNAFNHLKKIKGLGISYLTKVLYFATKAKNIENYALIFDIRVAGSLIKLNTPNEIYEIVHVGPSSKFKDYEKFNNIMHITARNNNITADQLEMYLFNQDFG